MELPEPPFIVEAITEYVSESNQIILAKGKFYNVIRIDESREWALSSDVISGDWFPVSYTKIVSNHNSTVATSTKTTTTETQIANTHPKTTQTPQYQPILTTYETFSKPFSSKKHILNSKTGETSKKSTMLVQICEASLISPPNEFCKKIKDMDVLVKVSIKLEKGKEDDKRAAYTESRKKTCEPSWNEEFSISIYTPESECLLIKVFHGKDKKKIYGELEFFLRSSERDYDYPHSKYTWYTLNKRDKNGHLNVPTLNKLMVYLQYRDSLNINMPTGFKRLGHIGMDEKGNFDLENLPPEWIKKFKELGIRKKDLENSDFAKDVFDIMNNAADTLQEFEPPETSPVPEIPAGYSEQQSVNVQTEIEEEAPPPPPPETTEETGTFVIPTLRHTKVEKKVSSAASPDDLLSMIRKGKALKSVDERKLNAIETTETLATNVTDLLKKAMKDRLVAVVGEPEEDDDDDWN